MGLGDWFRRIFSAPAKTADDEAVLRDEFGAESAESEAAPDPRLGAPGGAVMPGLPSSQAGEVVEAEREELGLPPDPAP
jgi:hypothetical protein